MLCTRSYCRFPATTITTLQHLTQCAIRNMCHIFKLFIPFVIVYWPAGIYNTGNAQIASCHCLRELKKPTSYIQHMKQVTLQNSMTQALLFSLMYKKLLETHFSVCTSTNCIYTNRKIGGKFDITCHLLYMLPSTLQVNTLHYIVLQCSATKWSKRNNTKQSY